MATSEITRPWTWQDQLQVICYGAPLHLAAVAALSFAKTAGFGHAVANRLSRANNRFIGTFRPGGRRIVRAR